MHAAARRFAGGDLDKGIRVPEQPSDEIDELGSALNTMAGEFRQMIGELDKEKSMLETILARTDDGLIVVDKEARIRMVNPAAERFLGTTSDQIQGKTVIEGTLNHDLSELAARVLRTGAPASLQVELSSPADAQLNVYVASLERPGGDLGAVIVMHDLSETRRIDSIRRDFVANVSHEFRTPLAAIRVMAETIAVRGKRDPEAATHFAEKIMNETDRLTALSEDLLDLAKIEAGLSITRQERFLLSEIVDRIVAEYTPVGERKGVTIGSLVTPDIAVHADKDAVYQILMNLVDNAVKYTQSGGTIHVTAEPAGDRVLIKVSDSGIGIPVEDLTRIFERFYRVDKARSRESGGTGLGLSIVKHLVEEHGGRVLAESGPGAGSTFSFTLPGTVRDGCV
jgi:two-component system phosphate regulon sensor histidine kinase PhoR